MQKKSLFIIEKLKNTESAQLCWSGPETRDITFCRYNTLTTDDNSIVSSSVIM